MSLSEVQVNDLARPLVGIITKFYADPKNEEDFQKWLRNVEERKQKESTDIGMILAFTGVATPLGVGLILAGAAALGTAVALNWDTLTNKLKGVTTKILAIAGAAALAIGIILCFTGVGIPLGVGLILSGAAALGTAVHRRKVHGKAPQYRRPSSTDRRNLLPNTN